MREVETSGGEVDSVHGDPECVEAWEAEDIRGGHVGAENVVRVASFRKRRGEEVVGDDAGAGFARESIDRYVASLTVGDAEVLEGIGVGAARGEEEEGEAEEEERSCHGLHLHGERGGYELDVVYL